MLKKFNFDYDASNDSLFLYSINSKSKASVEIDDFIIDFNAKNEISGIELLNASDFLSNLKMEGSNLNVKEFLKDIQECKLDIVTKQNFFVIKFMLISKSNEVLATPLVIPTLNESSPALVTTNH